jgi:hypothetical protein
MIIILISLCVLKGAPRAQTYYLVDVDWWGKQKEAVTYYEETVIIIMIQNVFITSCTCTVSDITYRHDDYDNIVVSIKY